MDSKDSTRVQHIRPFTYDEFSHERVSVFLWNSVPYLMDAVRNAGILPMLARMQGSVRLTSDTIQSYDQQDMKISVKVGEFEKQVCVDSNSLAAHFFLPKSGEEIKHIGDGTTVFDDSMLIDMVDTMMMLPQGWSIYSLKLEWIPLAIFLQRNIFMDRLRGILTPPLLHLLFCIRYRVPVNWAKALSDIMHSSFKHWSTSTIKQSPQHLLKISTLLSSPLSEPRLTMLAVDDEFDIRIHGIMRDAMQCLLEDEVKTLLLEFCSLELRKMDGCVPEYLVPQLDMSLMLADNKHLKPYSRPPPGMELIPEAFVQKTTTSTSDSKKKTASGLKTAMQIEPRCNDRRKKNIREMKGKEYIDLTCDDSPHSPVVIRSIKEKEPLKYGRIR